jgi:hypothetical protein
MTEVAMRKSVQQDEVVRSHVVARRIDLLTRQFAAEVEASAEVADFLSRFEGERADVQPAVVTGTHNTLSAHRRA